MELWRKTVKRLLLWEVNRRRWSQLWGAGRSNFSQMESGRPGNGWDGEGECPWGEERWKQKLGEHPRSGRWEEKEESEEWPEREGRGGKNSRIPCHKVFRRGGIEGRVGGPKGAEEGKLQQQGLRLDMQLPRRFQWMKASPETPQISWIPCVWYILRWRLPGGQKNRAVCSDLQRSGGQLCN